MRKTEIEPSENNFVAEYMLNERLTHVFVSSFKKFTRSVLERFFLFYLAISVDMLSTQQQLE